LILSILQNITASYL